MKLSKENFSKFLEGDKKNFIILFLVFFFILIAIDYFYQKTIKEITRETPPLSEKELPKENIPFLVAGKVKLLKENTLTVETGKELMTFIVAQETLFYSQKLPETGRRVPLERGLESLKIGNEIRVLYIRVGEVFWASEIWL